MDIVKIIGIGIIGTAAAVAVKEAKPSASIGISIATVTVIFASAVLELSYCINVVKEITNGFNIENEYIDTIIKMIGVAYLAEFGAQVCRDAGESAVATKIELAGKVVIVTYSIPVLVALLNLLASIMP